LHFSGAHSAKSSDGVSMNTFLPLRISVDFVNVTDELDDVVVVVVVVVVLLVLDVSRFSLAPLPLSLSPLSLS